MEVKEIMEMTESDRIRLYISKYKTAEDADPAPRRSVKKKKTVEYIVKLSSGLDAVIERKEKSESKLLILMPSQDKYLFKQGEVVQDIEKTDEEDFRSFFKSLQSDEILVNNIVIDKITLADVGYLYNMVKNHREELHEGMMSLSFLKSGIYRFLKDDKKLYKMIITKTPILSNQEKYDASFIGMVKNFSEYRGYDAARTFTESYTKSSMIGVTDNSSYYWRRSYYGYGCSGSEGVVSEKSLDTKTLIQYLCFGLYVQGFKRMPVDVYRDYLRMSVEYDGKIRDKYPAALLTAHDIAYMKYQMNKEKIDMINFAKSYDTIKSMHDLKSNVVFEYKDISLVIPESSKDLIDEGQRLGHCVGSYISRVASKECIILFGRRKGNPDESYLTVELRPFNEFGKLNYSIAQIQGDMKRTKLTKEETDFFTKLMDTMKFKTTNINFDLKYRV